MINKILKNKIGFILYISLCVNLLLFINVQEGQNISYISRPMSSAAHPPISIDGNTSLDAYCSGNGTDGLSWNTAHVLEDFEINAEIVAGVGSGIEIENTDRYLIIRDCTLQDSEGAWSAGGIFLSQCHNISITGCSFSNNEVGISLYQSTHISITDNDVLNGITGVRLSNSDNNNISGNEVSYNNNYAVYLDANSENNQVFQNTFCENTGTVNDLGSNNQIFGNIGCPPAPVISGYNFVLMVLTISLVISLIIYSRRFKGTML